jgi:microsomal dipeptidase-like Zn-dependent dipeptidase/GMP synthase-like glutamine amidotransferase
MKRTDNFDWKSTYQAMTSDLPSEQSRPVIGITGNLGSQLCTLAEGYYRSVLLAGGIPVIIPPYEQTDILADQLDNLDGIIFSGGGDINPLYLGEEPIRELHGVTPVRDAQELLLAKLAYDRQIPMLGICKGIQIIAAALGGKLYQDINTQVEGISVKHSQDLDRGTASHTVTIEPDSLLYRIFAEATGCLHVNSFHHQAVKQVPEGFKVSAMSPDGVIEAIESTTFKSIIGVQWHPECFCLNGDECMLPLFRWLTTEATSFRKAKRLHHRILALDSHCDTPMFFDQDINFQSRDPKILVDLHKMTEGHLDASIMVAYLKQEGRDDASLLAATKKADRILDEIEAMVAKSPDFISISKTPADLYQNKQAGRKSIMLGIENGYAIGKDLSNVERFRNRGVAYMTLCHNGDNDICDSAKGNNEHGGVSAFGEKVIQEMNRVGMMVDLSHASEKSFYDAIDISKLPIVCSHSSSRLLCDHPRNLTDEQMRRLAQSGGVAQVTFYDGFLKKEGGATIIDAINHLNHMVDVMGIEHVGIGTDFDGDGGVTGLASASELINFTRQLLQQRYSDHDIELIWGANFLRVMGVCRHSSL